VGNFRAVIWATYHEVLHVGRNWILSHPFYLKLFQLLILIFKLKGLPSLISTVLYLGVVMKRSVFLFPFSCGKKSLSIRAVSTQLLPTIHPPSFVEVVKLFIVPLVFMCSASERLRTRNRNLL
jgi:hypothetical protein